jgi:hypothetical protein
MATRKRIMRELEAMNKDRSSNMHAELIDGSNIMHLRGWFPGPPETPYEGGTYYVDIQLPDNYPFVPPKMKFETRMWHPNISSQTVGFFLSLLPSFLLRRWLVANAKVRGLYVSTPSARSGVPSSLSRPPFCLYRASSLRQSRTIPRTRRWPG